MEVSAARLTEPVPRTATTTAAHEPKPVTWSIFDALLGVPMVVALTASVAVIFAAAFPDNRAAATIAVLAAFQIVLGGWPALVAARKGNGPIKDFGLRLDGFADFAASVGIAFSLLVLAGGVVGRILSLLLDVDVGDASNTSFVVDQVGSPTFWWLAVLTVVGAPIAEELFFRGLVLRSVQRRFGTGLAVAVSTVSFTVIHYDGRSLAPALLLFGVIGTIGLSLSLLTVRRGRIGPAIVVHAAFNAFVLLASIAGSAG